MNVPSFRARTFACALLASAASVGLAPHHAWAETKLINTPADKYVIAPGGVDMRTGRYVYSETDLAIGGGEQSGGLVLTRTTPNFVGAHANPFGNFSHNWDIMLLETRVDLATGNSVGNDYRMNVHFGGRSITFEGSQNSTGWAFKSDGPRATLSSSGGTKASASVFYTFNAPDGSTMLFRPMGGEDCADQNWGNSTWGGGRRRCAFISELTQPDGTRYAFDYAYDGGASGNRARLRRVTSSRGYALLLEGNGSKVTEACVLNLAQSVVPSDGLCPINALAASSYAYTLGGSLQSVTGPDGAVSSFTYTPSGNQTAMGFIKPGQTTPWLTNVITARMDEEEAAQETVDSQTFADGQSYTYSYSVTPPTDNKPNTTIAGGAFTDALGRTTHVIFDFPIMHGANTPGSACPQLPCLDPVPDDPSIVYQQTPGPIEVIDPLQRSTKSDYCDPVVMASLPSNEHNRCVVIPLQSFTDPEGIQTFLEYDTFRNITKVRRKPKPGSIGLSDIETSAAYDIANPKSATKPLWTKDANGNVTNYTYAPEHGGLLTETGPAVNGIRPQTRNSYVQRYAWISNGGGYVQSSSPIWLLSETSFCRSSAATGNPSSPCAVSGDEVRTTYDYGPETSPGNLLLRGTVVTADGQSLRTCRSYDGLGRLVSETKPRANLSSCP